MHHFNPIITMLRFHAKAKLPQSFVRQRVFSTANCSPWQSIETKWQNRWAQKMSLDAVNSSDKSKEKYYCLAMFPYPSGQLHIGHVRVYTISDCISRMKRMQGFEVMHPMGWDAFGLPAENAAIERGVSPADWTVSNIAQAKKQLKSLGIQFDWDREVTTCSEDYYKWTQWLFLELFNNGLAYRKEAVVNWDPIDNTVLANEQVDAEGRSWRSGAVVEQKKLNQWFLRISAYADRLLDDVHMLQRWPEAVKRMQQSWIGRSKGSSVQFKVRADSATSDLMDLSVFTTRVDTIHGVTFLAIAPESTVVDALIHQVPDALKDDVQKFVCKVKNMPKESRNKGNTSSGIFTGLYALHPLTDQKIPIFLAEYVLPQYGTGVIMGVPAHDARDNEFSWYHNLDIVSVVTPDNSKLNDNQDDIFSGHGILINSAEFSGMKSEDAQEQLNALLTSEQKGGESTQFRLRDWLVSRQRYWGTPVPIIHCESCGPVGVPVKDLPVKLPQLGKESASELRGGDGKSPLARMKSWKTTVCPKCGGCAERDTDTLDTFVDSSWYYMRYCDAKNSKEAFSTSSSSKWLKDGVDLYVGGIEHAILHLLYSRFITKFLYDCKLIPTEEPFNQLLAQGMVLGRTYKSLGSLRCLKPDEYYTDKDGKIREKTTNDEVISVWEKMSKSKYNGVDPEVIRSKHGADVTRLVVLFKAPPSHELEWDESDLSGQSRWISRMWSLVNEGIQEHQQCENSQEDEAIRLYLHGCIKRVTEALEEHQSFNVAIAELMKLSNFLGEKKSFQGTAAYRESLEMLVRMLAPLAPHTASEMYEVLTEAGLVKNDTKMDVHESAWPQYNPDLLASANVKIVLQVQGKTRDTIFIPANLQKDKEEIYRLAMESKQFQKHLNGKTVRKAILVSPKKQGAHGLLNIIAT